MTANEKKLTYDPSLFPPLEEPVFDLSNTCNDFLLSGMMLHIF